jgi:chromosomal replication initiator protein
MPKKGFKYEKKWEDTLQVMQYKLSRKEFLSWLRNSKELNSKNNDISLEMSYLFRTRGSDKSNDENDSGYTLNSDLAGEYTSSGRIVYLACELVTQSPGELANLNPFFLYGGDSEDRKHLIYAIINHLLHKNPEYNIGNKFPEEFTDDLILAIREGNIGSFHKKYIGFDVLIINEIQFLGGKGCAIGEFGNILDTCYKADKQIILTADRHPDKISYLSGRLGNYIHLGFIDSIKPDSMIAYALLKKNAERCLSEFSDEVLRYIADYLPYNSFRQLIDVLHKLDAYANLTGTSIELSFVKKIMQSFILVRNNNITLELIKNETAQHFKLNPDDFTSQNNDEHIVVARHVALYISWELTDTPLSEIGPYFGINSMEEAINYCNRIKELMGTDEKIKWDVNQIIDKMA